MIYCIFGGSWIETKFIDQVFDGNLYMSRMCDISGVE